MRIVPQKIETETQSCQLLKSLGVSDQGIHILSPKTQFFCFRIDDVSSWEANIIKQHMLSFGTDAALDRQVLVKEVQTSLLVFGTVSQLKKLCQRLKTQPFHLKEIAHCLEQYLQGLTKFTGS